MPGPSALKDNYRRGNSRRPRRMCGSFFGRRRGGGQPEQKELHKTNLRGWQVHGLPNRRARHLLLLPERMGQLSGIMELGRHR